MQNRISISLDDELADLWKDLPHGQRSIVIRQAAKLIMKFINETGSAGLGMIINGDIKLVESIDKS